MKAKHTITKPMRGSKSRFKGEVYSHTILPQEIRKITSEQPNLTYEGIRESRRNKTQSQQVVSHKNQAEIKEVKTKQQKISMKLKVGSLK